MTAGASRSRTPRVAVIAGDGIGPEVTAEALRALRAASDVTGRPVEVECLPYGAEHWLRTGETLPAEALERIRTGFDAVFVGAVGDSRVPDDRHMRDILLGLRFGLDCFANVRPTPLLHDPLTPLRGRTAEEVDFTVVRENTEGLYLGRGRVVHAGTPDETHVAEEVHTRRGVERIVRFAFEWARRHGKDRVTLADKANAVPAHRLWRRVFEEMRAEYPEVRSEMRYADALLLDLVRTPGRHRVIVANNLLGDLISDLTAALTGGLGLAPSANLNPGRVSLFEPVHGSAPELAGRDAASPMAAILTIAMLLDHLGNAEGARRVHEAVRDALRSRVSTADLGGAHGTRAVGEWIAARVATTDERNRPSGYSTT